MIWRGRVLRDTNSGPGLMSVRGKKYSFTLEEMWQSEVPPRSGMVVDVSFGSQGAPEVVRAVPESELLREEAESPRDRGRREAERKRATSAPRRSTLLAFGLLITSWFFLGSVSVGQVHFAELTLWQMLNSAGGSRGDAIDRRPTPQLRDGLIPLGVMVALCGPLLPSLWADRRAALGATLPFLLLLAAPLLLRHDLRSLLASAAANHAAPPGAGPSGAGTLFYDIGAGVPLSMLASLYLAISGVKSFAAFPRTAP